MKKLAFSWGVFVILLISAFQAHAGIDDGLLLRWSFDDCTMTDLTGNGYNGTISGTVTCVDAVKSLGMQFSADSGAYATLAKTLDPNQTKAFSFWINSIGFHNKDDSSIIISKYNWYGDRSFVFSSADNKNQISRIYAKFYHDGGSHDGDRLCSYYPEQPTDETVEVLVNKPLEFGTWNHVVINVLDAKIEMWINGQLVSRKDRLYADYYNSGEPTQVGNEFLIGPDFNYRYYLNGTLDEFRVYSRSLTSAEILELFSNADPTPGGSVKGIITDSSTGEGISTADISFNRGAYELTTASDGTFSSSAIPAGTYQVEISAANYFTKTISNVTLSTGMTTDLSAALTPKSPVIVSTGATPGQVYNDGATTTLLTAKVTDPDGSWDISSVVVDLAQIGGSATQEMYDDGTHGDAVSGDSVYSSQTTVAADTPVQQFSLNVTASDLYGFKAYGNIALKVIKRVIATVKPEQTDTHTITNSLSKQTLIVSFKLDSSGAANDGGFDGESACYVELTVYRPDGTVYGVYNVSESLDISIPEAEGGDWTFETVNKCPDSVTYELQTKGSGTGMFVGRITNAYTGLGVVSATVTCNTGGSTMTLDEGYFSGIAVAGTDAAVTSTATGYYTNVQENITIQAGATASFAIQMVSDASAPQPAPSSKQWYKIIEPKKDPAPLTQPFAVKASAGGLCFNALFPLYQEPVNIYLGISPDLPGMSGKIFLFNENNELVEMTDNTLYPWREGVTNAQSSQILSVPLIDLPSFNCTLYSVVTADPVSLSNYDIVSFTFSHKSVLAAPTLTVTTSGATVSLSWTSVAGATGYTLYYAPYPYAGPQTIGSFDMGTKTSMSASLWEGAAFYVAIQAYDSVESSGYSNIEYFATDCAYSISPTTKSFTSSGGTGSVNVMTTSGCTWAATSNESWITIISGSSGAGNGTVGYSVSSNSGTSSRTGTITIAGETFVVTVTGSNDMSGSYKVTNTVDATNCGEGVYIYSRIWDVTQNGNNISISGSDGFGNPFVFTGTLNGNTLSISGSYKDGSGTTNVTGTCIVSGNTFSGSATWTWRNTYGSCSGSDKISGVKQ